MHEKKRNAKPKRLPQFSIAVLLVLMLICAIVFGWMADRQRLMSQIPVPTDQRSVLYPLVNADPDLMTKKLSVLFQRARIVSLPDTNEVVVTASMKDLDNIRYAIRHLDRRGTQLTKLAESDATPPATPAKKSNATPKTIPLPSANDQN